MRKLAISLALASTALASPALARDDQWYVGVDGGAMIVEDFDLDIGVNENAASIEADKGYDFGGVVGYDFGGFRLESEVSYREADLDSISVAAGGIPVNAGTLPLSNGDFETAGDANALSFMVNGLLDFGNDDGLQGFVGGGVGVARVDVHNTLAAPTWLDDSDTGFAWQALAGIRAPISDSWDVGLKYRFFNADKVNLVDRLGRAVDTRFRSHSLMGSLIYNFGGAPEPVEVAPPPPPPYVAPPPHHHRHPRPQYAILVLTSCSSIGISRTCVQTRLRFLTTLLLSTPIAATQRSCWRVMPISPVQRRTTLVFRSVVTRPYVRTLSPRALPVARSPAKRSVKLHRWYKPQMVSVNRKTVAWKSPTVRVRACNRPIWLYQIQKMAGCKTGHFCLG